MISYELKYTRKSKRQQKQLKSVPLLLRVSVNSFLDMLEVDPDLCVSKSKRVFQIGDKCFSKEISRGDRIVYKVIEARKTIIILSLFGHYCDNGGRKHMQA